MRTFNTIHRFSVAALLLFFYTCLQFAAKAQVSTSYTFSTDTVALGATPLNLPVGGATMAGGTLIASGGPGSGTDDHVYPNIPIGFKFKYNGKFYDSIGISSNGFAWFGTTNPAPNEYNPVSDNFGAAGVISVYGASIEGREYTGGGTTPPATIEYKTIGASPNKIFIVEWNNFASKSLIDTAYDASGSGYNDNRFDMWLVLYQCSYVIEPLVNTNTYFWVETDSIISAGDTIKHQPLLSGECGLRGASNSDYFNCSYNCVTQSNSLGQLLGVTDLVPYAPTGSNSTMTIMGNSDCFPGTLYGTFIFTPPYIDIAGGNPQAWIYTPQSFSITSVTATNPACTSVPETVTVNAAGGTSPFSLTWTATGGGASPASGNAKDITSFPYNGISTTFSSTGTGTISFSFTDSVGCPADSSISITVQSCAGSDTIATGTITGSPFCPCTAVTVPFTGSGTFNTGNVYTAQLSDATGSFASPVNIGTLTSTANSGNIAASIPCNITAGNGYRIRVISSNPPVTGTDNGVNLVVNVSNIIPAVVVNGPANAFCAGTSVTFTATATNGGSTPAYTWEVNDITAGTDSPSFTTNALYNGEEVKCVLASSISCTATTADSVTADVLQGPDLLLDSLSILLCPGTSAQVTASGATTYQWSPSEGLNCTTCATVTINATTSTFYKITGTSGSCSTTDTMLVLSTCPGNALPSAFTPNGDGKDDFFHVLGPTISNFDLKIFDRWGEKVFESNDQTIGWDGTFKSKPQPIGVYVWEITGTDNLGNKALVNGKSCGNVMLIR